MVSEVLLVDACMEQKSVDVGEHRVAKFSTAFTDDDLLLDDPERVACGVCGHEQHGWECVECAVYPDSPIYFQHDFVPAPSRSRTAGWRGRIEHPVNNC